MYSVTTLLYQQLTPHCVCAEYVNGSPRSDTDNGAAARIAQGTEKEEDGNEKDKRYRK